MVDQYSSIDSTMVENMPKSDTTLNTELKGSRKDMDSGLVQSQFKADRNSFISYDQIKFLTNTESS
jgi:hypothetical protein